MAEEIICQTKLILAEDFCRKADIGYERPDLADLWPACVVNLPGVPLHLGAYFTFRGAVAFLSAVRLIDGGVPVEVAACLARLHAWADHMGRCDSVFNLTGLAIEALESAKVEANEIWRAGDPGGDCAGGAIVLRLVAEELR